MSDGFEDLSARARRSLLSEPERQRLGVLLRSSPEARLWHAAGRELDAEGNVAPGDHDAAARVMERLLGQASQPRRAARWRFLPVAVASVLVVSGALAAVEAVRVLRAPPAAPGAAPLASVVVAPKAPAPHHSVAAIVETAPRAVTSVAAPDPAALAPIDSSRAAAAFSARDASDGTAAELFRSAALARRQGSPVQAIALLDSLQARYPRSREARSADMTLGALHLQRGAPAAALEHFQRYSRSSSQGELVAEALWGEYQALTALGRPAEALARLQRIAQQFPSSPYAATARSKLSSESRKP